MTQDTTQPAGSAAEGDGHWKVWRRAGAVAVVLMLVLALWVANGLGEPSVRRAVLAEDALGQSSEAYQAGRYLDAIDLATAVIAAVPDSADAFDILAVSYLELGMYEEGLHVALEAIRLRPDDQRTRDTLAMIQQKQAQAALPPVPAAQAVQANALLNQSLQHSGAGRWRECVDAATQATNLNPNSAAAFSNLGFCAAGLRQWDEAIRSTLEAIRLDPSLQLARNNLNWMLRERLNRRVESTQ